MVPLYVFLICLSGMVVGGVSLMFCCCIRNYKSPESRKNYPQKPNDNKEDDDRNNDVETGDHSMFEDHDEHDHKEHDEDEHNEHGSDSEHPQTVLKEDDSASIHSNIGVAMAVAVVSAGLVGFTPPGGGEKSSSKEPLQDKEVDSLFSVNEKEEKREDNRSVHFGEDEPKRKEDKDDKDDRKQSGGFGGFMEAGTHRDDWDNGDRNLTSYSDNAY